MPSTNAFSLTDEWRTTLPVEELPPRVERAAYWLQGRIVALGSAGGAVEFGSALNLRLLGYLTQELPMRAELRWQAADGFSTVRAGLQSTEGWYLVSTTDFGVRYRAALLHKVHVFRDATEATDGGWTGSG